MVIFENAKKYTFLEKRVFLLNKGKNCVYENMCDFWSKSYGRQFHGFSGSFHGQVEGQSAGILERMHVLY